MDRVPEPELMNDEAQARAYAEADFAEPNQRFVDRFLAQAPALDAGAVVDLGCGPGDIALRIARARPGLSLTGVDGAEAMLALARAATGELAGRVRWHRALVPDTGLAREFDAVISNSLLHHLHDPAGLWTAVAALGRPGAEVLVVDLARPASTEDARALVDAYAAGEPEVLRTDFYNSLLAAFTVEEIRGQLETAGLALAVETISDRHLAISGRL